MTDPFRSELEAAHQRIATIEQESQARVEKLERENERLRKRLTDVAPSRSKTGKTFFGIAMMTLGLSLVAGMFFARIAHRPDAPPYLINENPVFELGAGSSADETPPTGEFEIDRASRALADVRLDECLPAGAPRVEGHARVTFAPSGHVSQITIDEPNRSTSLGTCVENKYRSAHVPPFSGAPRVVGKAFVIH